MDSSESDISLGSPMLPRSLKKRSAVTNSKVPSKLSLRKHFRKSLTLENSLKTKRNNVANSSSESTTSNNEKFYSALKHNCTIVISDDDDDVNVEKDEESFKEAIDKWLEQEEGFICNEISPIHESALKKSVKNNRAFNSTFVSNVSTKRFDEFIRKQEKSCNKVVKKENQVKTDNSVIIIEDSFEDNKDVRSDTGGSNKQKLSLEELDDSHVNILNQLYGDLWKNYKEEAPKTPTSAFIKQVNTEKKSSNVKSSILKNVTKTEPKKKATKWKGSAIKKNIDLEASNIKLLNDLYGDEWRRNADDVFKTPNSKWISKIETEKKPDKSNNDRLGLVNSNSNTDPNPRKNSNQPINHLTKDKKKKKSVTHKNPYLDTEQQKSRELLNSLSKERKIARTKSPWTERLKRLGNSSSDNESDNEAKEEANFPVKTLFNDSYDEDSDDENKGKRSAKTVPQHLAEIVQKPSNDPLKLFNDEWKKKRAKNVPRHVLKEFNGKRNVEDDRIRDLRKNADSEIGRQNNFLGSLSDSPSDVYNDNSARVFRKTFKTTKQELALKLFQMYNETVFESKIPADTIIEWNNRMRGTAGFCYCRKVTSKTTGITRTVRIVLSVKVLDSPGRLRDTLIHEMCHAAAWIVNEVADGHGQYWKFWANKAMRIFYALPPITVRHSYDIKTKYTYKCTGCGYSIGRHSKSLNVEKFRCGRCMGKFEVFLNKTTKDGQVQQVATPKKGPNKFAQFVKDNYGTMRTPDRNHKDVMNLLSKKFAAISAT